MDGEQKGVLVSLTWAWTILACLILYQKLGYLLCEAS